MSKFLSERYSALTPYVPGEQPKDAKYIKLNTNESPYPPSPAAFEALKKEEIDKLRLYPDPEASSLKKALSDCYGVNESEIFVANGSDELLAFCFMAFSGDERGVAFPDISYGFYPVYASLFGLKSEIIPLKEDFTSDLEGFCRTKANVVIANPNAPTGLFLPLSGVRKILEADLERLVIVDEAYVDFGAESALPLLKEYENLLIVQTFSKSRALAGGRLGFAFGRKEIIADLDLIRYSFNSYNVNRLTEFLGAKAVSDREYFEKNCALIARTRDYLSEKLNGLGFTVLPSKANFILASPNKLTGKEYYLKLKEKGILVRYFDKERLYPFVRITVGSPEEAEALIACTEEILK